MAPVFSKLSIAVEIELGMQIQGRFGRNGPDGSTPTTSCPSVARAQDLEYLGYEGWYARPRESLLRLFPSAA